MASKKTHKGPAKELATIGVKLNYTPTERDLIEQARALGDERKVGAWIRKASLKVARDAIEAARA